MRTGEAIAVGWWACHYQSREGEQFSVRIGLNDGGAIEVFCKDQGAVEKLLLTLDKCAVKGEKKA